jgi:hypothetical protein
MSSRPSVVGPDAGPEAPYPLHMEGTVISGFGRGSKEVNILTAIYSYHILSYSHPPAWHPNRQPPCR